MKLLYKKFRDAPDEAERVTVQAQIDHERSKIAQLAATPAELVACEQNSDCELRIDCWPCTGDWAVAVEVSDFRAVNRSSPSRQPVSCKPCQLATPLDDPVFGFYAVCDRGQCKGVDVRQSELSACRADGDCVLRGGVDCCERCDGGLTAVSNRVIAARELCGADSADCTPCPPRTDASTLCVSGHCTVKLASETGAPRP